MNKPTTYWRTETAYADGSGEVYYRTGVMLKDGANSWGCLCYSPDKNEAWFWDTALMEGEVTHFRCENWETAEILKKALNTGSYNHAGFVMSSIQKINKLREISGFGMVDCQKALKDTEGDFDAAIEVLRRKNIAVVLKKAA